MNQPDLSLYCPFCHRHTAVSIGMLTVKAGMSTMKVQATIESNGQPRAAIGLCNNSECKRPLLLVWSYGNSNPAVYPRPLPKPSDERIPDNLRHDLDEAKVCFASEAFRGCAVLARRLVQAVCLDKQASSKENLVEQINEIHANGIITTDIKDWAHAVR